MYDAKLKQHFQEPHVKFLITCFSIVYKLLHENALQALHCGLRGVG